MKFTLKKSRPHPLPLPGWGGEGGGAGAMKYPARKFIFKLSQPFRSDGHLNIPLVLIYVVMNGLVLFNCRLHAPWVGYDANAHLSYIKALSCFQLVTPGKSPEFFSPPLPYLLPALFYAATGKLILAAKFAQLLNFFASLGLTWFLLKSCNLISPGPGLKTGTMMFLAILTVYYKTFSFVRGEPYTALFAMILFYFALVILVRRHFSTRNIICSGVAMGCAALSRQWGLLLIPAVLLFGLWQMILYPGFRKQILKALSMGIMVSFMISGWFYLHLKYRYGSFTTFNGKAADSFHFQNQPSVFYLGTGNGKMFSDPAEPAFPNQLFPVFHTEVWGDYWAVFVNYGKETNVTRFVNGYDLHPIYLSGRRLTWISHPFFRGADYLGRVNLISLFPATLALAALIFSLVRTLRIGNKGLLRNRRKEAERLGLLFILFTFCGYFWFLIMYPGHPDGNTIKATYVLQAFPLIALFAGNFMEWLKNHTRYGYQLLMAGLMLVFAHNFFALLTHYWFLRLF